MKPTEHNAFQKEATDAVNRICRENRHVTELRWFLNTALMRFHPDYLHNRKPQVIAIGDDIPAEILYAACDRPFYVLGGSLGTAHWADELTPRDTDPFSRSSLGWLLNPAFDLTENALIVTAVSSDSRRKLISVLESSGKKVAALDVPPQRTTDVALSFYTEQLEALAQAIGKHTGKRVSGRSLKQAVEKWSRARSVRAKFLSAVCFEKGALTDEAALLVSQCMFFSDSLDEWTAHALRLIKKLEGAKKYDVTKKPRVLLLGSPVVFPNYKVPQLIDAAGMHIAAVADSLTLQSSLAVEKAKGIPTAGKLLRQIAQTHLRMTAAGAKISNDGLFSYFAYLTKKLRPDGIVCHILKGQIEYDFELPRIEKAAEELDIPVFRLETDYQYQDLEQLRIRMEAFGEMLTQRKIVSNKRRRTA